MTPEERPGYQALSNERQLPEFFIVRDFAQERE